MCQKTSIFRYVTKLVIFDYVVTLKRGRKH